MGAGEDSYPKGIRPVSRLRNQRGRGLLLRLQVSGHDPDFFT